MAEFTKGVPTVAAPSYIGLSKEADKPQPNKTLGTLFKGIGDTLGNVVNLIDEENKTQIDNALYKGVDEIRGAQGVDAAVEAVQPLIPEKVAAEGAGTPPQVESTVSSIDRLTKARADGKIGDTQYWSQVEAQVRMIRARYPGYREEIDKKVSQITGTTPANALRKAIDTDLQTAANRKQSEEDKFDTFVKQNFENMSPEARQRWVRGDRSATFKAEVFDEVGKTQAQVAEVTRERARIGLAKERNELTQEDALGTVTSEVNQYVNRTFNTATSTGANGQDLMSRINRLVAAGKGATPEEQAQIRSQFALLKASVSGGIDSIFTTPLTRGGTDSYSSVIKDPGKLKAAKEQAMARLDNMEQLLINGEFGLFSANAIYAKASEDSATRKLLESTDAAGTLQAAVKILGNNAGVWLNTPGGMKTLNAVSEAINRNSVAQAITGKAGSGVKQLDTMKEQSVKDPAVFIDYLKKNNQLLADPKTPAEALINLNKTFYDQANNEFLTRFVGGSKERAYAQLTTPEITANMIKLKETDPASWERYKNWTTTNFYNINKRNIDEIAGLARNDLGIVVKLNETGKIELIDNNPSGYRKDMMPGDSMVRGPRIQSLRTMVEQFNRGIDTITPILKQDNLKPTEALGAVYSQMGLASKEDKETGNSEGQGKSSSLSLGNTIQLASYGSDERAIEGRRDADLINLNNEDLIDLDSKPLKGTRVQALANAGKFSPILDVIGKAEAPGGYNQIFGRNREAPLNSMTISDVFAFQRRMLQSGSESTAVGRYQFLRDTLKETVAALGIDPETTKFTPEVQDRLALALVGKPLQAYADGRIDAETLADRLADKWAGLPLANGRSKYAGVGSNKATIDRATVLDAILRAQ